MDFTTGVELWARFRLAMPQANTQLWAGMASDVPNNDPTNDQWNEACIFHVLTTGQIDLEVWENGSLVQTIANVGTMPSDGTFVELAYHYDGERIDIAIDGLTITGALMPIVPTITLHGLMGVGDTGGSGTDIGQFDYYYSAQLRV